MQGGRQPPSSSRAWTGCPACKLAKWFKRGRETIWCSCEVPGLCVGHSRVRDYPGQCHGVVDLNQASSCTVSKWASGSGISISICESRGYILQIFRPIIWFWTRIFLQSVNVCCRLKVACHDTLLNFLTNINTWQKTCTSIMNWRYSQASSKLNLKSWTASPVSPSTNS